MKIKLETQAKRCEICHQVDKFDPVIEKCFRCNELTDIASFDKTKTTPFKSEIKKGYISGNKLRILKQVFSCLIALPLTFCFSVLCIGLLKMPIYKNYHPGTCEMDPIVGMFLVSWLILVLAYTVTRLWNYVIFSNQPNKLHYVKYYSTLIFTFPVVVFFLLTSIGYLPIVIFTFLPTFLICLARSKINAYSLKS